MTPFRKHIERQDLPSVLSASPLFPKFYMKCPKTGEERAALGSCLTLTSIPENSPNCCFYGAVPFSDTKSPLWKDFPSPLFFLPEIEIIQTEKDTVMILRKKGSSFKSAFLEKALPLKKKEEPFAKKNWSTSVQKALQQIEKGHVSKVVLARKAEFELSSSPYSLLQRLIQKCPSTATFSFQTAQSSLFLGSTPEKLYEKNGSTLQSEAIAGTRKRGKTEEEDVALARELLDSEKDMQEVLFVRDFLQKSLSPFSKSFPASEEATLVKTDKVQHLRFPFKVTLKEGVEDIDLIQALHPTPAVGGTPTAQAKKLLKELEDFERGLYAGLVGWISSSSSKLYVAIRSGLVQGDTFHIFTGAGIVKGSKDEKEWEEIEYKTSHWLDT